MNKMDLYRFLPIWLQNIACSYEGYNIKKTRYGKDFEDALRELESHNSWSYDQMCEYRDSQLQRLVKHCYNTVPYYHKLFDDGGINPDSIKTLDDLKVLPILKKETIKNNPQQFLSSAFSQSNLIDISTSGSTGSSLILHVVPDNIAKQYAVWWRYRKRLGINFDMWHSEFGSRIIVPPQQKNPPYWRTTRPLKQVMFSAFHGNPTTFPLYYEKMRRDNFNWIHATPSVFMPFVSFCLEQGYQFDNQVKFITTGAENLYDFQKKMIKNVFNIEPRTHYGLTEAVANFSENQDGVMEVDEDFAAVEFIKEDDFYHIVGTSLINYSMPLLRYATNDIAFVSGKIGRYGRIVDRIDGRNGDCIYLPNGTRIATLSALFSETNNIVEAQIHQQRDYSLVIQFVPKCDGYERDLEAVKKMLIDRVGTAINFRFEQVEKIQRTARGKLRYIISDINQ